MHMTKRKHREICEPSTSNSRPEPLLTLKTKLDKTAQLLRDTIIPARIEYLQSIITTTFNLPFWEPPEPADATEDRAEGPTHKKSRVGVNSLLNVRDKSLETTTFKQPFWESPDPEDVTEGRAEGPAYKKSSIDINFPPDVMRENSVVALQTDFTEQLEKKLNILKIESSYLAAACSSLQLWDTLSGKRGKCFSIVALRSGLMCRLDDTLLEVFGSMQQQALKLRSCLAKVYEERVGLLCNQRNEVERDKIGGKKTGVERALEEYNKRIDELAGCQAVTLIASYVNILDSLSGLDLVA